jgi:hypothetical protein
MSIGDSHASHEGGAEWEVDLASVSPNRSSSSSSSSSSSGERDAQYPAMSEEDLAFWGGHREEE